MYQLSEITEAIIKNRYNGEESEILNERNNFSKDEVLRLLRDFITMINSHSDKDDTIYLSNSVKISIQDTMNALMDDHCYLSDYYPVTPDGIIRDGTGFIYAGQATKPYDVGMKLPRKLNAKIMKIVDARWYRCPIIMLSRAYKNKPQVEKYMYFTTDENGDYYCFRVSVNTDEELGLAFNNYFYTLLPEPIDMHDIKNTYAFTANTKGDKARLNKLPMGTVVKLNTGTYVKVSPLGTSVCKRLFSGAIDI